MGFKYRRVGRLFRDSLTKRVLNKTEMDEFNVKLFDLKMDLEMNLNKNEKRLFQLVQSLQVVKWSGLNGGLKTGQQISVT